MALCRTCGSECSLKYEIVTLDQSKSSWYICKCGCIYNIDKVDVGIFGKDYKEKYMNAKSILDRTEYLRRNYIPLIEELTYGRRFLDVGFTYPYHFEPLKQRGWIVDGIDVMDNDYIKGNFEDYDFEYRRYDFINMGSVLESFNEPIKALHKAYWLLNPSGVLFIQTPDTDFMYLVGMQKFGHWNNKEHTVYWSQRKLNEELKKIGFEIVLSRKNYSQRYICWNNQHVIVQKSYIREKEEEEKDGI